VTTAALDGVELFHVEVGSGPPCLVMHGGLGADHLMYRPWLDALADRVELVYYDHRCNGRSSSPPLETMTIEQLADDAAALLAHLGYERAVVLGHSYGGFIAQELALRHPERVRALVLVDTTPGQLGTDEPTGDQGPPPPPEFFETMLELAEEQPDTARFLELMLPLYLHQADPVEVAAKMEGTISKLDVAQQSMAVLAGWSSVDRLGSIRGPVLVIGGRHDIFTSLPQSVRIATRIPGAQLEVFEASGHMPFIDEPERFTAVVGSWLGGLD
jgi:proline iminopeptidase